MQSHIHEKTQAEAGLAEAVQPAEGAELRTVEERAPGKALNTVSTEHSVESLMCSSQSVMLEIEQPAASETVTLMIVLVSHNITYRLETTSKLSVEALSELVDQELGISKQECVLMCKGQELREKSTEEVVLDSDSVVYVLPSRQPDSNDILTVNLQKGRTLVHSMSFMASDRVSKISTAVTDLLGVPPQHQTLMYCGAPLPNKTLLECRLINNCRVKLVISPEYKREMSKSCTFNDRKDKVELIKEPLPQIEELAKEVQSIEDIDDQIFEELAHPKIIEPSLEDSFEEHAQINSTMKKKRSTYSSAGGDHRITLSQQKPTKSEAPKLQRLLIPDLGTSGLLQVKEVSSVYNPDSDELNEPRSAQLRDPIGHVRGRLRSSHNSTDSPAEHTIRVTHFEEPPS